MGLFKKKKGHLADEITIINESVNAKLKAIFIAVPKTGTTSVRTQIRPTGNAMIPNPHLNIAQVRDLMYAFELKNALATNLSYPTVEHPDDAEVRRRAEEKFQLYFKFSAVRNPWARAASLYARREGVQTRDRHSFEEFLKDHLYASDTCRQPTLHQNQSDWHLDANGKSLMDYVYRVEDFESAVKEIAERTDGRVNIKVKDRNRNPESQSRNYQDLYTDETKEWIAKRFEQDIDLFKYTF